ncbi:MAG TPA: cation:proton antiporter [Candidatus Limnocylindria bacterium]|nr:cation:proton antiporter [Candidatus Limnocylindria bacterium]
MSDVLPFGLVIAAVSAAGLLAVWSNRISARVRIPAPAIFLIAAALASDLMPSLQRIPVVTVQRVVTVMLVLVLFHGGMHIGRRRFRTAAGAIVWLGVAGTALTTAGIALLAHLAFGLPWESALLIGVALAPTDPAVVFSVLGRREVEGRSGTLLEGESGANDPVGISTMAALLAAGGISGWHAVGVGVAEFAVQMLVGAAVGVAGGWLLGHLMRRVELPSAALYPLQTLLAAGVIFGAATVAHGSGFLAVFIAGILIGDLPAPYKRDVERVHASLASLGEIVAFAVLGLTVSISAMVRDGSLVAGIALGALIAVVVRPLLVGATLMPIRLSWGERFFVMWSGLKGAVPILLGTYVLTADVPDSHRLYDIVVVVVAFSVIVQGSLVPAVARWTGVPMRMTKAEP